MSWDFDDKQALAVRLKALRQDRDLSQQEVAERADIGVKSLSSWETGMRIHSIKLGQLRRVLLVYGMTIEEFFGGMPPAPPKVEIRYVIGRTNNKPRRPPDSGCGPMMAGNGPRMP